VTGTIPRSRAVSRPRRRNGLSAPGPAPAAGTPAGTASALRPLLLPEAATYSQQTVPGNRGMIIGACRLSGAVTFKAAGTRGLNCAGDLNPQVGEISLDLGLNS